MTEDNGKSTKKYSRRSSGSRMSDSSLPSSTSMEAKVVLSRIMVPSIDSPGTYSEAQLSNESPSGSPSKTDDNGEICALCNCGSEMALILGQLTQYSVSQSTFKKLEKIKNDANKTNSLPLSSSDENSKKELLKEKTFYKRRRRKPFAEWESNLPPDMTTFGTSQIQEFSEILDRDGCLWAHHCCAAWSTGVCQTDSYDLENVDRAVAKALMKKCSHCQRYGASIECQVHRCNKLYHYPCCASAGAFQNITSMILLCPDHLDRAEKIPDAEAFCDSCQKTENMNLQLFCTSCGRHFHSYCVDMTIPITPVVRMGWQCSFCKVCQGCKQPGDEDKMLCCDHCDKGYHTYCLSPPISSVPKSSWKCLSCRKCDDCGSTRAGGGPSCRWHNNFTLCDRCYQQRKKGQCCPLCNRAIRLFNNVDILQCTKCFKCVHGECDPDGAEANKYVCPTCISNQLNGIKIEKADVDMTYEAELAATGQKSISIEEAKLFSMAASADFIAKCSSLEYMNDDDDEKINFNDGYYGNKLDEKMSESTFDSPYSSVVSESVNGVPMQQNMRKKDSSSLSKRLKKSFRGRRFRGSSYSSITHRSDYHGSYKQEGDMSLSMDQLRKNADNITTNNIDEEEDDENGNGDDNGSQATVVIVSSKDSFSLKQDMCMSCGSLGKGKDGYLIGCVQCGQCFHPYCVNVKINEVILDRGWRCLDCTVCEGCGRNSDEAHLLLCDICDVSFHTYCLNPPLQDVPIGGWKCQWCVVCEDCGCKDAGFNCQWMANYTQCGQCSSEQYCSVCSYAYEPNNLVIQCEKCERWLHGECDGLYSESDANLACSLTYHCCQCRPVTKHLGIYSNLKTSVVSKVIKRAVTNSLMQPINPPAIKKTKTLQQIKVKKLTRLEIKEQKRAELEAMPLIPNDASTNENGTFGIDLGLLKSRLRMDDIAKPSFSLTDTGMKQIKSQVIRAPITRTIRKPRKLDDLSKGTAIMSEEVSCSNDGNEESKLNEQDVDMPDEMDALGVESEILSPDLIKREEISEMDGMQPDTTDNLITDDSQDTPDPEDVTDPFEFFGVNLLEKQLHMEIESDEFILSRKKIKREKRKEKRLRKAAKLAEAARLAFDTLRGPSVPDPTAAIVHMSPKLKASEPSLPTTSEPVTTSAPAVITSPVIITTEEVVDTNEETPTNCQITNSQVTTIDESMVSSNNSSVITSLQESTLSNQELKSHSTSDNLSDMADPNSLDIRDMQDLPRVEGHEVEQIFAGMAQEDKHKFLGNDLPVSLMDNVPDQLLHPDAADDFSKLDPNPLLANPSLLHEDSNADVFKAVFGEHINNPMLITTNPKKGNDFGHSKIDTQKQLKKWEQDEKLGENSTISPVLYANLVHKNLVNEYKDWSSRARAIARLWRKLPSDQREPFRLRARDNRVKKKGANKASAVIQQLNTNPNSSSDIMTSNNLTTSSDNPMLPPPTISPDEENSMSSDSQKMMNLTTTPICKQETSMMSTPTIMTVSEPQKLSPLLNNLSPSFSMSSISGMTPTSPVSPAFFPNTPVTTKPSDDHTFKSPSVIKPEKPKTKRPKLSKEEREQKKLQKKMQTTLLQEKEKQWKILQTQRLFEQQRLAFLQQGGKPIEHQMQHPSVRFRNSASAPLNPAFPDDPMQHLIQKMQSEHEKMLNPPPREVPSSSTGISNANPQSLSGPHTSDPLVEAPKTTPVKTVSHSDSFNTVSSSAHGSFAKPSETSVDSSIKTSVSPSSVFEKTKAELTHSTEMDATAVRSNLEMQQRQMENDLFFRAASSLDHSSLRNAEQHSYLLQQQQYMASQQQYIQWQLAQQQLFAGGKPPHGKELSDIDSEEKHQERIRYLYQQRQMGKDGNMYNMPHQPLMPPPHSVESTHVGAHVTPNQSPKVGADNISENISQPQSSDNPPVSASIISSNITQPSVISHQPPPNPAPPHMFADANNQSYPGFPGMNSAESAMYHQMLIEYMRCRKYDADPNVPPVQFYNNVAELAKQYYQRHSGYGGKVFPPGMPPHAQRPMYPPYPQSVSQSGRPYYDERNYQKGMNEYLPMGGPHYYPRESAIHEMPPPPQAQSSSIDNTSSSPFSKSKTTLQKSASFEISRIPADSTSNDDILPEPDNREVDEVCSNVNEVTVSQSEDEITSSKPNESQEDTSNIDNASQPSTNAQPVAEVVNEEKSTPVCSDGIHCGTDDEDEPKTKSAVCSDGIHCGTDDEDETKTKSGVCSDGIHCGTDDEDEPKTKSAVCSDGIHCGTDDEDETKTKSGVCSDGIHWGTDDEDETKTKSAVCSDGIHCGTDDEDETKTKSGVCSDGIHCGTDDEDETKTKSGICSDGIHCGTDDEDETKTKSAVCSDGIHCGTDDEDEPKTKSGVCSDGIHCGTDDDDEPKTKPGVCSDGIHCGTDDEDEPKTKSGVCSDGIHCGTDDEDETKTKSGVCSDGIHCGTDDEDETKTKSAVCSDGIHCGTDDEDEPKTKSGVCSDGIHCGTDDEDETKTKSGVCSDGIHCGTDDEDETKTKSAVCSDGIHCGTDDEDEPKTKSGVCSDGIHCGTDDDDEPKTKPGVCSDGIHCGTDDEDEPKTKSGVCSDGIHCGTDDEDETKTKSGVCSDGIHCGTDDEDETKTKSGVCSDGIHCGTDDEDETKTKSLHNVDNKKEIMENSDIQPDVFHSKKNNNISEIKRPVESDINLKSSYDMTAFDYSSENSNSNQLESGNTKFSHYTSEIQGSSGTSTSFLFNPTNTSVLSSPQFHAGYHMDPSASYHSNIHQSMNQHRNIPTTTSDSQYSSNLKYTGGEGHVTSAIRNSPMFEEEKDRSSPSNMMSPNVSKILSSFSASSPLGNSKSVLNSLPGSQKTSVFIPPGDLTDNSNMSDTRSNVASPAFMPSTMPSNKIDLPTDFLAGPASGNWPSTISSSLTAAQQSVIKDAGFNPNSNSSLQDFNLKADLSNQNSKTNAASIPKSPFSQCSSPAPKSNIISLHPGSPQYLQIFIYQHQLLIMQFQQYQFQLQAQYHQLSQHQQMSSQQQFLLQQQFHQQMVLLQQQFIQQQAQLHRMAASGIQFTEHQLNSMVQQQMLTQQNYRQWVMALSPEQQIHLQQRMQASMQQVQHQMSQIIQHARQEEEQKKKPKPRRLNKKKSSSTSSTNSLLNDPDKNEPVPRFPVPELSDEMKRAKSLKVPTINTCTAEVSSSLRFISSNINTPPKIETLESGVIKEATVRPQLPQPSPQQFTPININESSSSSSTAIKSPAIKSPTTIKSPLSFMGEEFLKKKTDVSSAIGGIPPSRYENIQESFLKQQQLVKEAAKQKAEQSLNTARSMAVQQRQSFFPIHPSQILANAKTQGIIKSPPAKSPTIPNSISTIISSSDIQNITAPFNSKVINPMTDTSSQKTAIIPPTSISNTPRSIEIDFSASNIPFTTSIPTASTVRSNFSVSDLLNSGPTKYGEYGVIKQTPTEHQQQAFVASISAIAKSQVSVVNEASLLKLQQDSNSNALQQQQLDANELLKKSINKPQKLKKDNKLLEEKKRLREIERQKKKDEKMQQRLLKEQKKAERQQQKLIKQKALQEAKLLANNSKKRQKIPPVPIPDMPSSDKTIVSPTAVTFMQKSPPPPVTPKIPLCEPEVHLIYPLAQPVGFSNQFKDMKQSGSYGTCEVIPTDDLYKEEEKLPVVSSELIDATQIECDVISDTNLFPNQLSSTFMDDHDNKLLVNESNQPVANDNIDTVEEEIREKKERVETDDENAVLQNEFMNLLRCNQCFSSYSTNATCWMLDKRIDMIFEVDVDFNEISISEHLSFCSQVCAEEFQRKNEMALINEDFEFIDAVKTAAMVTLDESHTFLPLPNERGEIFAQGMNITKLNQDMSQRRWKRWSYESMTSPTKKGSRHRLSKEDMELLMLRFDVRLKPSDGVRDYRSCMFCCGVGDGDPSLQSRLLNYDVGVWVHLNCALWSSEVYESLNGGLNRVEKAYARSCYTKCVWCEQVGATLHCSQTFGVQQRSHCEKTYHFTCAHYSHCTFYKDKTILCAEHKVYGNPDDELRTFSVRRKVYVERDITKQITKMLSLNNDYERKEFTFRIGNLIFHELGQVPLDLLPQFSTSEYIYPIGFETTIIYWDYTNPRQRRYYTCSIYERFRTPRFRVKVQSNGSEGIQYTNCAAKGAWDEIISNIQKQREKEALLKIFPEFICGEDLFGLSEATIQRMVESLPGIDTIATYNFRFGRTPILIAQLPLALNPTGCIRSEKVRKPHSNRPLAIRHATDSQSKTQAEPVIQDESWLTYSQRSIHSTKSGQYRRMRQEWRNNVVLGRSRIQGLGLFVKRDIEENTFLIEYIGSLIRNEVANRLEKLYERQNRGIYMFRIDSEVVVDATMTGGPARYINHSCEPNCVAEIVSVEKDKKIIIISNRRIEKGEELTYDYKLELEDDSDKIVCLCGSSVCRKWMN